MLFQNAIIASNKRNVCLTYEGIDAFDNDRSSYPPFLIVKHWLKNCTHSHEGDNFIHIGPNMTSHKGH